MKSLVKVIVGVLIFFCIISTVCVWSSGGQVDRVYDRVENAEEDPYLLAFKDALKQSDNAISYMREQKNLDFTERKLDSINIRYQESISALEYFQKQRWNDPAHEHLMEWARNRQLGLEQYRDCLYDSTSDFTCTVAEKFLANAELNWIDAEYELDK